MGDTTTELNTQIKEAIVRSLRLPITSEEIGDDLSLFEGGLGLDSIDVLELVLEIERQFGVAIADEQIGREVLQSVNAIAKFVQSQRSGASS